MKIKLTNVGFIFRRKLLITLMRTFIFLFCTSVFSFTPISTFSQSKVVIDEDREVSIEQIFKIIGQQTDYTFVYQQDLFKNAPKVQLKKGKIRVDRLLNQSIIATGDFDLVLTTNNTILVKEKSKKQQKQVSGNVVDEAGLPMPGVVIVIKGTTSGTATNFDGTYTITVPNPENVLVFSFLGFKTQEITVGDQSTINVTLKEDLEELSEVVVTGYQKISKERSAGSFAKPEMQTVQNRTTSMNILQRLDGLVPGLIINNSPNENFDLHEQAISIRGINTIRGDGNPLFVVDGVAISDVSSINPQDVADVTVLKDATAASIWGSRAANGVIVITTKRGGFNKKIKVDYDTFINFQGKPDLDYRPVLSSQQFIQAAREIFDPVAYDYLDESTYLGSTSNKSISVHNQILYDLHNGVIDQATADAMLNNLANTNNLNQIEDLFYRNAIVNNHTLSVQGGSEKHAFYGSLAYTDTQNNEPGSQNNVYKVNLNNDFKINKRINFSLNADLTNTISKRKRYFSPDNRFTPYALFKDANGENLTMNHVQVFSRDELVDLENASNINLNYIPLDEVNRGNTDFSALSARLNTNLNVTLFDGLSYRGTFGYFNQYSKNKSFDSPESYRVRLDKLALTIPNANPNLPPTSLLPEGGYLNTDDIFTSNWTFRNQLNYDNSFNDGLHKVTAVIGYESQKRFQNSRFNRYLGYDPLRQQAATADYASLQDVQGTLYLNRGNRSGLALFPYTERENEFRFTSFYSNIGYTFNDKYTINGSFRSDESSLFGIDKSAQNRPVWSAGAKWNISKENFMSDVNWIDNLALRATIGITGNSPRPGEASSFDILSSFPNVFPIIQSNPITSTIATPGNTKLSWERTKNLNLGLDFSLFNNRLRGNFDYYHNKTEDLLDQVSVNQFTGYARVNGNAGTLENKGIDLSINSINVEGDFRWTTGLILSYNKNEITSLLSFESTENRTAEFRTRIPSIGYPAFPIFAYDFVGLNNEGSPEIRLADGSITTEQLFTVEPEDSKFMGTYQPVWSGGFSNSFSAKGFTLTANMVYNLGHVMFIDTQDFYDGLILEGGGIRAGNFNAGNVHADFANRWRQPGDEATTNIPAYIPRRNQIRRWTNYYRYGSLNVTSASYIKLRDISLTYKLPDHVVEKISANHISFRLMLNNVMLWKENNKGIDPEFHNAPEGVRVNPTNQNTVTFGMHLTF